MRRLLRALAVVGTAGAGLSCADQPTDLADSLPAGSARPVFSAGAAGIEDRYIVVFQPHIMNASALGHQLASLHGGNVHFTYEHAIKGFAMTLPAAAVTALSQNPNIAYIEQDQVVTLSTTQPNATWGIDRIDQRALPRDGNYNYTSTGSGVRVYVHDTGIRTTHTEFGGRATVGFDAFGGNGQDCNGHGTHVAGTIGGATYGVAKGAQLVAVRVLDCTGSGTTSGVIAGLDWVTANHVKPAVANMSLGGGASTALDNAVINSIAAGVTYAIAAGNSNANACNASPARVPAALTVGATTITDARSSFSNWGTCLDLFAPGTSITSAWYQTNTQIQTISGTSMAAPHVAGAAALFLQGTPTATPTQVASAILGAATTGTVTTPGTGSPNRLLYSLFAATPPPPPPPPGSQYEAEQAAKVGMKVASFFAGYTGTGYVRFLNSTGSYVEWTVNAASAGTYNLTFRYSSTNANGPLEIRVNDQVVNARLSFPSTGAATTWRTVSLPVTLNAGVNRVRAASIGSSGPNMDNLVVQ